MPPLVERELLVAARRPGFYWLRGLLALVAGFKGYELFERFVSAPTPRPGMVVLGPMTAAVTGADLLRELAWLVFVAALLMGLVTADSISRERREGTLGLLLLTGLTPAQIVQGKMLSCGLTSFLALLGFLPALMTTVLAGGVSGTQALLTGLGLLNTLFVALAAGLWMSAVFRERRHALLATLGLVAVLGFGAQVFGGAYLGAAAVPMVRLFGLSGWMTVARLPAQLGFMLIQFAILAGWFALTHALGWLFLRQAATALAQNWQDAPHKQVREPDPADEWSNPSAAPSRADEPVPVTEAGAIPARVSWLTDPRPWDADPVRWRVERIGSPEGLIWLAVLFDFFAQFGVLGSLFDDQAGPADSWGLLSFAGVLAIAAASGVLAWVGARFFQHTRREQDLELLLTTPVGGRDILAGQWRVIRRALAWPLSVLLALALPAGIALTYDWANGHREEVWLLLHPFLIAVNLALEVLTLCWVGMAFGLRARNVMSAVARSVGLVQLAPLALAVAIMASWSWLAGQSSSVLASFDKMPAVIPALLFFLAKNVALLGWARFRLRRDLRLGGRKTRLDEPARRLVLQPA